MRYLTYIAEQAFKTSTSGERLFCRGGRWSRPHVIPNIAILDCAPSGGVILCISSR